MKRNTNLPRFLETKMLILQEDQHFSDTSGTFAARDFNSMKLSALTFDNLQ
jgi:hypothetical protein